jgi:hypothetical protein
MGRIGKIATLKRDFSTTSLKTMDKGLAEKNMTRIPGTGVFKFPYKELSGKYRTGLDPLAAYIQRIQDPDEKAAEIERVTKLKEKLEGLLEVDLGRRSSFWDHSKSTSPEDTGHVRPAKLLDGVNLFALDDPFKELTYSWLRVHPTIASSYQAWERGEFPADTQFYVADEDIENAVVFKKKQKINKAIAKLEEMTPEKKKKVARQLGLPVSDNTKEEVVYNMIDSALKETEFKSGKYQGMSSVDMFHRFADMKEDILHIKDVIAQALSLNIYRVKPGGKITQGEAEVAKDEESLLKYLLSEENQDALITIEGEIQRKKLMAV